MENEEVPVYRVEMAVKNDALVSVPFLAGFKAKHFTQVSISCSQPQNRWNTGARANDYIRSRVPKTG